MEERLEYLENIAQFTNKPIKELLKREAINWIDEIFIKTEIEFDIFSSSFKMISLMKNPNQSAFNKYATHIKIIYFIYDMKNCHVRFEKRKNHYDIWYVCKNIFKLNRFEFETLLRFKVKHLIKQNMSSNFPELQMPHKKIKFFMI